jgi:RNA polymerase sigma factor (sigma-70 family)
VVGKKVSLHVEAHIAVELVQRFRPVVRAVCTALYAGVSDQAALVSAGDEAILYAYRTHDPAKANLATWTRRQIHWHLAKALERVCMPIADESYDPVDPQLLNGADPEEQFWAATAAHAVGRLDPREATILMARMQGETYAEVAETISITPQRAHEVGARALERLREVLEEQ